MSAGYKKDQVLNVENQVDQILKNEVAKKRRPRIEMDVGEKKDVCYHNTRKLLQSYRAAMVCISQSMDELADECLEELGNKFESLEEFAKSADFDLSNVRIESRIRSMQRNRKMLALINRAVDSLRKYGENGEEYYLLLWYKYLCPNREKCRSDVEIVYKLNDKGLAITKSTFYRKLILATQSLGDILWGYTAREVVEITDSLLPEDL